MCPAVLCLKFCSVKQLRPVRLWMQSRWSKRHERERQRRASVSM